ncbi:MAG: hypothetical protein HeimC3_23140 [Candidatus Heimdallarchaeota archaeon LC_3]|nr:MAG: hypothetical protein HeimC3_23140 [Candidatus Heimdallarchaeota archaeon LC_3]
MYKILITNRAEKDIKLLNKSLKKTIGEKIDLLRENPVKYSRKLSDSKIGNYRLRVGDYRIVFDIEDNFIIILRIGHRRKIYS